MGLPYLRSQYVSIILASIVPLSKLKEEWKWKVYDHHVHMTLLDAVNAGCEDISLKSARVGLDFPEGTLQDALS